MKSRAVIIGWMLILILFSGCISKTRKVENVRTFAKVYGYVRWFYPGDEAAQNDWNKFAVYGIQKVENARDEKELQKILLELFQPVAPAIQIVNANLNKSFDIHSILPKDTSGLNSVSWSHYGVYLGEQSNVYKSARINKDSIARIGEFIRKNIGNHLTLLMPLALYKYGEQPFHLTLLIPSTLYKSDEHTYPVSDLIQLNRLKEQLNAIPDSSLNTKNPAVRLANVVIAWNVLQHFFPYFDVVHTDWDKELPKTLNELYSEETEVEYYKSMMRMTAKLEDAHVDISGSVPVAKGLSIKVELFGQDIVVTASSSNIIRNGDIIKSIDGKSALTEFHEIESQISGTPNLKRNRALRYFGTDFSKPEAKVTLIRDGKEIRVTAQRFPNHLQYVFNQGKNLPGMIDCGDGIFYLKGVITDINSLLGTLVNAKGIIVGNSYLLRQLLPHMIKEPVWCTRWNIPINTYPDRQKTYWDQRGRWTIEPKFPLLKARFAVITSSDDQSYLETLLGIFDHYKMGFTVGDTTAGCNGNVNYTPLIGNSTIRWTGMKVLKHDYSQHHLIGFNPDYPIVRTKDAVLQARDEYLEKAKEILKKEIELQYSTVDNKL